MPELTPREEYALELGNCRQCGAPHSDDLSDAECVEALADGVVRKTQGLPIYQDLSGWGPHLLCNRCMAARDAASASRRRAEHADDVWRRTYGAKLLPEKAKTQSFECSIAAKERNPAAWAWGRAWTPSSGNGWLYGTVGTGKTYLARAIASAQLAQGYTVAETTGPEWCAKSGDFKWTDHRDKLSEVGFLIFDDIDKGVWRHTSLQAFVGLNNTRYDDGKRTVITSNGDPSFVVKKIWQPVQGENDSVVYALTDRLKPCQRWELTGPSLRGGE
jgi:DNA replication protein DnaC